MNAGLKEKAILAMLGVLALYALAVGSWFVHFQRAWKQASKRYDDAQKEFVRHERLIAEKQTWVDAYEQEKLQMPMFGTDKSADTAWLGKVEDIAKKYPLRIGDLDHGQENQAGDVFEMTIESKSKNWEASLDALTHFLHELENTNEGMFDIRELDIQPSSKKGYLRFSFVLTCAYMRED